MSGIGIAKKGLGLLKKYRKAIRERAASQTGWKSGVVDRNVKSKDVFKIIKGLKKKPKGKFSTFPSEIVRTLKSRKGKAFGKGALIGGAAASGLEYKRRKDRGDYKKGKK